VGFTQLVEVRAGFTSEADRLLSALEIETDGSDTSLIDAAHAAMVLGDSATGRPLVIIFSDGADTTSFLTPNLVLDTARRTGAVVYAVTSAQAEVGGFLDELVGLTGGRRFDVPSLDRLSATFDRILAELRDRYLLGYTPTGVPRAGWHDLTVRVRGGGEIRARPGYLTAR
jgi:Ca-activated chloride channel family protein